MYGWPLCTVCTVCHDTLATASSAGQQKHVVHGGENPPLNSLAGLEGFCWTVMRTRWVVAELLAAVRLDKQQSEMGIKKESIRSKEAGQDVCAQCQATEPALMFVSVSCYLDWAYQDAPLSLPAPSSTPSVLFQAKWLFGTRAAGACESRLRAVAGEAKGPE